jgi:catechol 2,3-dioxygenase-like lactoylglutathione lyase family enzyme
MAGNREFELQGVNHLALVCKDMARTVDFYTNVLGMPLIKTIDLPMGMGQHFFFDIGNGDALAFFWFPDAPAAQPGIASAGHLPTSGKSIASAHGSMNHVAINVPAKRSTNIMRSSLPRVSNRPRFSITTIPNTR